MALPERIEAAQPGPIEDAPEGERRLQRSMADMELAFSQEISLERRRRDSLRRTTEQRMLKREVHRRHRRGSMRFVLLVLTLILTAAIVTVVMFRTLYLLLS